MSTISKPVPLARVILYVKDMPEVAAFYQLHFGLRPLPTTRKDWLELASASGDCTIALHQASVTQKTGAAIKLVFAVKGVGDFVRKARKTGLDFGPLHHADGFEFANAKDPAGNSIQISSRGIR